MWIVAPSSVRRIARASITIEPSLRINIQSADPGTTAPRKRAPANSPPEAALNTRRPSGPSPPSNRAPSPARIVNRWVRPGPATASPLFDDTELFIGLSFLIEPGLLHAVLSTDLECSV